MCARAHRCVRNIHPLQGGMHACAPAHMPAQHTLCSRGSVHVCTHARGCTIHTLCRAGCMHVCARTPVHNIYPLQRGMRGCITSTPAEGQTTSADRRACAHIHALPLQEGVRAHLHTPTSPRSMGTLTHPTAVPSHPPLLAPCPPAGGPSQGTRGEAMGRGWVLLVWEEALPGRSAPARRASTCKAPSGSAPAMPAVPGLRSSLRASSPGGSARLTAWRLFIRRQRQRELLADAGAFVLQGSLLIASRAAPHLPPAPLSASVPRCTVRTRGGTWGGSQPQRTPCHSRTCHKAPACGDARQLPRSPHPRHPSASPAAWPRVWRWHPKGGWGQEESGHPTRGFAARHRQPRWGAPPKPAPSAATRSAGSRRWHGDKPGREAAPQHLGEREQSLSISFLAGPGCPPLCTPRPPPALGHGDTIKSVFC